VPVLQIEMTEMNETPVTVENASPSQSHGDVRPSGTSRPSKVARVAWTVARMVYVRSRFLLLLAGLGLVLGRWDDLRTWSDRALERLSGAALVPKTVSPDTEFFCPMCPGVVTRWPEKCPVCKMPLVRRKKGDAGILPSGVTARMQLTPYRVQLAGVKTVPATYRSLIAEIQAAGQAEASEGSPSIDVVVSPLDAQWVRVGQLATVRLVGGDATQSWDATVTEVRRATENGASSNEKTASGAGIASNRNEGLPVIAVLKVAGDPRPADGASCVATIKTLLAERQPFSSIPHDAPPLNPQEVRTVFSCPDHPDYLFLESGKCPFDENELASKSLAADERLEWWCPAHGEVTARKPGESCAQCADQSLLPRIVNYWPAGQVLAIPDTAVIDAAHTSIVFVETAPGMFDGRAVDVGPEVDGLVSVVRGIAVGEKVAVTGAFLLDAETRLNPAVASAYFGAAGGAGSTSTSSSSISRADTGQNSLDPFRLPPRDRALALLQRVCPVTRLPLGSMGAPIPIVLPDRTFYLCCEGCRSRLPKRTQIAAESRRSP
jgi:Cu(I)/Ag(I) efflux system membrane fusion protein